MSVSEDGTLSIEPVQRGDAGQYICKGLSIAGSAYAKARLDVRGYLFYIFSYKKTAEIYLFCLTSLL